MGKARGTSKGGRVSAPDYGMQHRPPGPDYGARGDDLTTMLPEDIYDPRVRLRYYGTGFDQADRESFAVVDAMRGNPGAMVTVYRALPSDQSSITTGDWVTLSLTYARVHLEGPRGGEGHIIAARVPAASLWTNGDSINEWGYSGRPVRRARVVRR